METIVYTYKKPKYQILQKPTDQKYWIKLSIESARKCGYTNLELYTNDRKFAEGLNIDKVHYIDDEYEIWDSFKIHVLDTRTDEYFLCDNDVVFKQKINFSNNIDIHFDGYETKNWEWLYEPILIDLKNKKCFDESKVWSYDTIPVINTGILKINNSSLKNDYISHWKTLYYLSNPFVESYAGIGITPILSQYFLGLLVRDGKYTTQNFSGNDWSFDNKFYTHHVGSKKLQSIYLI
jgi:hypothetical protein